MGQSIKETFETLLEYCASNRRVCPMPQRWNDLYGMLRNTRSIGAGFEPAAPLILGAWGHTSDEEKQERLKIHIQWADKNSQIEEVGKYLRSLSEKDWAHIGEI